MDLAKRIRLNRIFAHPSKRLCSVAVDHFVGYQKGLPEGLVNLPETIRKLVEGKPDAITMVKGTAKSAWEPYAGRVPLIIQVGLLHGRRCHDREYRPSRRSAAPRRGRHRRVHRRARPQ